MATYKLIPSSLTAGNAYITNQENAFTDADSSSYASVTLGKSGTTEDCAFLGGFDFDAIPNIEDTISITVRLKASTNQSGASIDAYIIKFETSKYGNSTLSNGSTVGTTITARAFTLSGTVEEILPFLRSMCIIIINKSNTQQPGISIYGADVVIETADPPTPQKGKNKITFGSQTLIDLTSDTVTERDVRGGASFHLPSGVQSVGSLLSPYQRKASLSTPSSSAQLTFTGLKKEPSWFIAVCSISESETTYRVVHMIYDGETFYIRKEGSSSEYGIIESTNRYVSFSYSDGTLTFTSSSSSAVLYYAGWELYYL